ncbi:MAG TPA: hypothetical protein VLK33_14890 [Terriglobales bacterium]|nr:hypothetical protein [Terriglobales bacterium]
MKKSFVVLFSVIFSTLTFAQAPAPAASANSAPNRINPGSLLPVELAKTVDAKKAKSGDPVMGKIPHDLSANGKVVIPQDAKVIGHVAEVKSSNHDSKDSKLGIVFDKISMKDGGEIPLTAEIQAVAAPIQMASAGAYNSAGPPPQNNPAGTSQTSPMGGGQGASASAPQSQPDPTSGMPASTDPANPPLTASSQGVVGMKGYSLAQGSMQDSVISSQEHNVKLESGTQILLKTK